MKIKYLFAAPILSLSLVSGVFADGTVTHLSGPVTITNAQGKSGPAQPGVKVVTGDTVVTGSGAYVRIEMSDGAEMVLRPDSSLRIDNYHYAQGKPAEDKSSFSMLKGGLRSISGMIGKRGNNDAYEMKTPTATIGIRGTQWDVRVCDSGSCGALANGTYLGVRFGAILASNQLGSVPIVAGQFAHVPHGQQPVLLPRDPGVGFTPPPSIPKLDEKKKIQAEQKNAPANNGTAGTGSGTGTAQSQTGSTSPATNNRSGTEQASGTATSNGSTAAPSTTSGDQSSANTGQTRTQGAAGSAAGANCSLQ